MTWPTALTRDPERQAACDRLMALQPRVEALPDDDGRWISWTADEISIQIAELAERPADPLTDTERAHLFNVVGCSVAAVQRWQHSAVVLLPSEGYEAPWLKRNGGTGIFAYFDVSQDQVWSGLDAMQKACDQFWAQENGVVRPPPPPEDHANVDVLLTERTRQLSTVAINRLEELHRACEAWDIKPYTKNLKATLAAVPIDFSDPVAVEAFGEMLQETKDFFKGSEGGRSEKSVIACTQIEGIWTLGSDIIHLASLRADLNAGMADVEFVLVVSASEVSVGDRWDVPVDVNAPPPAGWVEFQQRQAERERQPEQPDAPSTEEAPKPIGLPALILVDPRSLAGHVVPPRLWLVEDWAPMGETSLFYGDGGRGKTRLAQQLLTSTATGNHWLGMPVKKVPALGIFCEDSNDELHRRQDDINRSLGIGFRDLGEMRWISRVGEDNALIRFKPNGGVGVRQAFWFQVRDAALAMRARCVVLDGAADTFAGLEINRGQVREFIQLGCTSLAREINGCVILLAHPSAAGMASDRGDGGSTAWSNSVRARWYLTNQKPLTGALADPDARVLRNMKSNYSALADDIHLVWRDGVFVRPEQINTGSGVFAAVSKANVCEAAFVEALASLNKQGMIVSARKGGAAYAPKIMAKLSSFKGVARVDLERAMLDALDHGTIAQVSHGKPSLGGTRLVLKSGDQEGAGYGH